MPQIPVYRSQVAPAALPGPRVSAAVDPDVHGAALGKALRRGAVQAIGIVQAEQRRADRQAASAAVTEARRWALREREDPEAGYARLGGRDLLDYSAGAEERARETLDGIAGKLTPAQREMVQADLDDVFDGYRFGLARYERGVQDEMYQGTAQAERDSLIELAASESVAGPVDFGRVERKKRQLRDTISEFARLNPHLLGGREPAQYVEDEMRADSDRLHGATLALLSGRDPESAAAYYERYGPEMSVGARAKWEGPLRRASELAQFATVSEAVVGEFRPYVGGDREALGVALPSVQRREALAAARARGEQLGMSPAQLRELQQQVGDDWDLALKDAEASQRQEFAVAQEAVIAAGGDTTSVEAAMPEVWARLLPSQRASLDELRDEKAQERALFELDVLAETNRAEYLERIEGLQDRMRLTDSQWDQEVARAEKIRKGEYDVGSLAATAVKALSEKAGFDEEQTYRLHRRAAETIRDAEVGGKRLDESQRAEVVERLMWDEAFYVGLFAVDLDARLAFETPDTVSLRDFDSRHAAEATEALRGLRGREPSEAEVLARLLEEAALFGTQTARGGPAGGLVAPAEMTPAETLQAEQRQAADVLRFMQRHREEMARRGMLGVMAPPVGPD